MFKKLHKLYEKYISKKKKSQLDKFEDTLLELQHYKQTLSFDDPEHKAINKLQIKIEKIIHKLKSESK
ncbi:MAG: hypothetical protein IE909_06405 [Campylobacterales bacterium]|nr:hypothetical protein [Campylobacterales bacterium]